MMVDRTKFGESKSNDLKAIDFKGKNLKLVISSIEDRHYEARGDQPAQDKLALHFSGKEKTLVLNKTNTKIIINAFGPDDDNWIGKEISLSTHETEMGEGWVVTPLNVEPPDFDDDIPF
jgi:F0F1-type ATP synthase alpha subunit